MFISRMDVAPALEHIESKMPALPFAATVRDSGICLLQRKMSCPSQCLLCFSFC